MAEEAFALSPISARPNLPGEADYDAIREAFMETARGRWFLNEYAKRNRHTDTGMVLEAVARIEANLKAQKQPAVLSLSEALGSIRAAMRQAKATAIESLPRTDADDTRTAARNGARIVREIASTMRECGADVRICDLLDTQARAIDASLHDGNADGREKVLASYDLLMQRIEALADGRAAEAYAPTVDAETPPAAPKPTPPAEARASVTPLFKAAVPEPAAEQMAMPEPVVAQAVQPEPVVERMTAPSVEAAPVAASNPVAPVEVSSAGTPSGIAEVSISDTTGQATAEAETAALDAEAHDLAVLDMIAVEMAVQDFSEPEAVEPDVEEPEMAAPAISQAPIVEPEAMETVAAVAAPAPEVVAPVPHVAPVALAPQPQPQRQSSLGAALIANGVIANPNAPTSDPLAPIRRMSQAEKIAFFS